MHEAYLGEGEERRDLVTLMLLLWAGVVLIPGLVRANTLLSDGLVPGRIWLVPGCVADLTGVPAPLLLDVIL